MGMGWKKVSGGSYSKRECKCGKGKIEVYVSDCQESEHKPNKGDTYTVENTCPDKCMSTENLSQNDLKHLNIVFKNI